MNTEKLLPLSLYLQREYNRNQSNFETEALQQTYAEGELVNSLMAEVNACDDITCLNQVLRQIRNREMVRIALRDLSDKADEVETIGDLSDLAQGLIAGALEWHYSRACEKFGVPIGFESQKPQKMLIIGMGKLGGRELNFSSDIDLIFAYPEKGYATNQNGKETPNDQFFIRLGQALNKSLADFTKDGFVYRVDMRLRPFGNTGPLAVSFNELENYYAMHGRAWERYALVKARVIAGDFEEGENLFKILRPFVYRKYIDYSSMDSLRELKQMIHAEVVKKEMSNNIKLGRGGIREVEFIAQVFQLINGGRDKNLQSRSLLKTLQVCAEKNYLTEQESLNLKTAYLFLRKAENRLQEWNDQQTHDLPESEEQQQALAESMGFDSYPDFINVLEKHRDFVQQQFDLTFEETEQEEVVSEQSLTELGFTEPELVFAEIKKFENSATFNRASKDSIDRFEQVLPKVIAEIANHDNKLITLQRLLTLFEKILQRSVYLVLLIENKAAIVNLVQLCSMSQWLADRLVKSPALFDQLLDGDILFDPLNREELFSEAEQIRVHTQGDDEQFMNQIREWRHAQVFKVAASDVTDHLPVMKTSDNLTWIAESVLNAVAEYAWQLMMTKNGLPDGVDMQRRPLLILGYGKMGGIELGYGSDLDIVFLFTGMKSSGQTQIDQSKGEKQLSNGVFMTRLVQKIISLMSTLMPTGKLYEIDTRLRPNGKSGLIVGDFESFVAYQNNKAWTWEHQALVRARAVVADKSGEEAFVQFKKEFIQQPRDRAKLKQDVVEMRQKMRDSLDKSTDELFDLKQGVGGIVDIEFMVQYLVLGYASDYPQLADHSDNISTLDVLCELELLENLGFNNSQIQQLENAYCHYRSLYHRLALQNEPTKIAVEIVKNEREAIIEVWEKLLAI